MTKSEIASMMAEIGYPYAYFSFKKKEAPPLPYVVWYFPSSSPETADDETYADVRALNIELYTEGKDFEAEAKVQAVLDAHEIPYITTESYIDDEDMYEVLYESEVLFNGQS